MRPPLQRGSAVNNIRIQHWLGHFANYRTPVTQFSIELWMDQFANNERDLAARLLDSVLFMNPVTIQHAYRQLLSGLQGWHVNQNQRQGRWFFVPFSGSTGESGDSMLHFFRIANNLTQKKFHNLFIHRSEISTKNLTEEDTVVLIDDFSATGDQACTSWDQIFKELFIGSPRIFLFLVAATNDAIVRINQDTDMEVHCHRILLNRDNIFHADCPYYTQPEKNRILHYCRRADNVNPRGRGNKGLLVVFSHRCPNNTIPILHANHNNWSGLFPRFI